MDPRYTDFGELEFVSIASYSIIEKKKKNKKSVTSPISFVQQLKAMSILGWGGNQFCILLTQSGYQKNH